MSPIRIVEGSEVYRKTIDRDYEGDGVQVTLTSSKDPDGNIECFSVHLHWDEMSDMDVQGLSLTESMLSEINRHCNARGRRAGWRLTTDDQQVQIDVDVGCYNTTYCLVDAKRKQFITIGYSAFCKFLNIIPCLEFIMRALRASNKERIALDVLSVILLMLSRGAINKPFLKRQFTRKSHLIDVVEKTLNLPHQVMLSVLPSDALLLKCKEEISNEVLYNYEMITPIVENEL